MTTFTVATNEFIGHRKEKAEYQSNGKVYPVSLDTASLTRSSSSAVNGAAAKRWTTV